ncbi:hypothetical protein FB45DRAFT_948034 [Roridomyces roridus]|uniref:Uncharacterized protein n=1 Tax=Roridomyces roridus TaxID=1738132 RepID=A0AAD7B0S5_9AGAR|nr:hypothetical protein FB45DRAFT_948034 [Roridomyces roridus]
MSNDTLLPDFTRLGPTEPFSVLRKLLWPASEETWANDLALDEPERLATFIQEFTPDDQDSPSKIRYIDLTKNPSLAVDQLAALDVLIVRQDYLDFMAQTQRSRKLDGKPRYGREYLTGEHGTGKSVGAFYFLFRLLAAGQPVFFTPNTNAGIYYFSKSGVDFLQEEGMTMDRKAVMHVVRGSWVIINDPKWQPGNWWVEATLGGIWTAAPEGEWLMQQLTMQLKAGAWGMKPWSPGEIAAVKTLRTNQLQ